MSRIREGRIIKRRPPLRGDALVLTLIALMFIGSCRSSTEPLVARELSATRLIHVKTTKDKVLERLGEPKERSADGRFLLYQYWEQGRKKVKWSTSDFELVSRKMYEVQLIIEFDSNDRIKRYKTHKCKTDNDPVCNRAKSLCEMLKKLGDEDLLAVYCRSS